MNDLDQARRVSDAIAPSVYEKLPVPEVLELPGELGRAIWASAVRDYLKGAPAPVS